MKLLILIFALVVTTSCSNVEYELTDFKNDRAQLIDETFRFVLLYRSQREDFDWCLNQWLETGLIKDSWNKIREDFGEFRVLALVETGAVQFASYEAQFIIKSNETTALIGCSFDPVSRLQVIKRQCLDSIALDNVLRYLDKELNVFELESSVSRVIYDGSCTFVTLNFQGKQNRFLDRDYYDFSEGSHGNFNRYMDSLFNFTANSLTDSSLRSE